MKKLLAAILVTLVVVNGILAVGMSNKSHQLDEEIAKVQQLQEELEWAQLEAVEHWYE